MAEAFAAYRTAVLAKDGQAVAGLLTAESIEYYAAIKKLAMTAREPYLRQARVSDQLVVVKLRTSVPAENLRRWSPSRLVVDAVERGDMNSASVQRMSSGEVDVAGDIGTVQLKVDGHDSPLSFTFYREGGRWKFRLIPLLEATETALRARMQEQHITERRLVDDQLAATLTPEQIKAGWLPTG
ncbi:hypothetical protein [Kribbella sp. ALI-6-A]|uniref:hypothetical protein n=1 Tax=Kribbella sp. ALI-6-A TaxID=1933817 RepID=UPI00117A0193|nr:hypothetical protein [Kribbella sp. ALI-6-A]